MIKYIPNILTVFRMIMVPVFIWLIFFFSPEKSGAIFGLIVFIIASISDYYDGMLARKYKIVSNFGKVMDPLADKFLVAAALFALALPPIKFIHISVVVIILVREVGITILRDYYAKKEIYIPANMWGKVKTTFQMTGIIAALLYYSVRFYVNIPEKINNNFIIGFQIFFWVIVVITLMSGVSYLKPHKK